MKALLVGERPNELQWDGHSPDTNSESLVRSCS